MKNIQKYLFHKIHGIYKNTVFTAFLLIYFFSFEVNASPPVKTNQNKASPLQEKNFRAKGIILHFHQWPTIKEKKEINNQAQKTGLKIALKIQRFNVWVLDGKQEILATKLKALCKNFSNISSLKSCAPDYVVIPSATDSSLKDCNIVLSDLELLNGQLSDYWAQEAIGADLLREKLKTKNSINKPLVELFDIHDESAHDIGVKNLISGGGRQAVLPELNDKINISQTKYSSQLLAAANRLLNTADSQCASVTNDDSTTGDSGGGGSETTPDNNPSPSPRAPSSGPQPPSQTRQSTDTPTPGSFDSPLTYDSNSHIILRDWLKGWASTDFQMHTLISFLERESVPIIYVNSPYVSGLKEAGESWAPTIHAVQNTYNNKLEEFKTQQGPTVYNRNMTVVWKTATTDWGLEDSTIALYDLDADYEINQEKNRWLKTREYSYVLRPPVVEMKSITITIDNDSFAWIPPIMLKDNTLKIWGTKDVGTAPITINGVTVTLTADSSDAISSVPGSAKNHGKWTVELTNQQVDTILGRN